MIPSNDPNEWESKLALDHGELVEHIPALQPKVAALNENDRGVQRLVIPNHALVREFAKDLKLRELRELEIVVGNIALPKDPDLKTARRKLRDATVRYRARILSRVGLISAQQLNERVRRIISLSEILIDDSEARFWHKIVTKLEYAAKVQNDNRAALARKKRDEELTAGIVRHHARRAYQ